MYKSIDLNQIVNNIAIFLGPVNPKGSNGTQKPCTKTTKICKQSKMTNQISASKCFPIIVPSKEEDSNVGKAEQSFVSTTNFEEKLVEPITIQEADSFDNCGSISSEQEQKLEIVHDVLQRVDLEKHLNTLDLL